MGRSACFGLGALEVDLHVDECVTVFLVPCLIPFYMITLMKMCWSRNTVLLYTACVARVLS